MTYSHVAHDMWIRPGTWLSPTCDIPQTCTRLDCNVFTWGTWLSPMCDIPQTCTRLDCNVFTWGTWLSPMCDIPQTCTRLDWCIIYISCCIELSKKPYVAGRIHNVFTWGSHTYVRHESHEYVFMCVAWCIHTWRIHMRHMWLSVFTESCDYLCSLGHVTIHIHRVVWLILLTGSCDYSYSLSYVTESRATCVITDSYVRHESHEYVFMCVAWRIHTWRIHMWDTSLMNTYSCVWHDAFIRDVFICETRVSWIRVHVCGMTHSYVTLDSCCSVLQCVAVCCSVLQCVAVYHVWVVSYGVATISRLLQIIGLFCKRAL